MLEEDLPPGKYRVEVTLSEPSSHRKWRASCNFEVTRGDVPLDVPSLRLEPSGSWTLAGKPAPEIEATDLDTGRLVTLADFRGKDVVLDFWGYWCGPCVGSMPHLVALRSKFSGRPLEVVALHDQSVQSREEYDRKIAVARRQLWGDRDLPFRVLLDRPDPKQPEDHEPIGSGSTVARYGIEGFPTLFVIDRDGTLIESIWFTDHDRLESLVRQLLANAEK